MVLWSFSSMSIISNTTFPGSLSGRKPGFWRRKAHETSNHYRHCDGGGTLRPGSCVPVCANRVFLLPALPDLSSDALALPRLRQHARAALAFAFGLSKRAPLQRFVHTAVSSRMLVAWLHLLSNHAL